MELIDKDKLDSFKYRSASERMDLPVDYMVGWNDAVDGIMANAPAVDAEPVRHGHWIRKLDTRFGPKLNDIIICSNCSIAFSTDNMIRKSYCPNCGAKMYEEKEE